MKRFLIAIDLSSSCTGWAVFDIQKKELLEYGNVKLSLKGISTLAYPHAPLAKIKRMATDVVEIIKRYEADLQLIGVEEVNRGIARFSQKTLDGAHWFFLEYLGGLIDVVVYRDTDGKDGWRTQLGHRLSDEDKLHNKEARVYNKGRPKADQFPIYAAKHITERWVNKKFNLSLDIEKVAGDSDIADAIGLGWALVENCHKD